MVKADWVSYDDALKTVLAGLAPLESEECDLEDALDRVLARDLTAPIDLPTWTNSAMDGFAVLGASIAGASTESPVRLQVLEDVPAGGFPTMRIGPGEATRVMTGAPVPDGADTVVRVEHTDGGSDIGNERAAVRIHSDQDVGRNLRRRGEEIRSGGVALAGGTVLSPAAIGVAASLGYGRIDVVRRPAVALLTSGDELVGVDDFEQVRAGRKIVSSNSYSLSAAIRTAGCEVRYLGIASDTPESLTEKIELAAGCDAIVTSAGISVGEHDHVKEVLRTFEAEIAFWRVRIKPGSPFAFGRIRRLNGIPWFGLPGNPVSSMVTFELFARPALARLAGRRRGIRRRIRARLLEDFSADSGLTQFIRVAVGQDPDGGWTVKSTGGQGSGMLSSVARSDGLMVLPATEAAVRAGDQVEVIPLDSAFWADSHV